MGQSTGHSAWLLQPLTAMQSQCSRRSKHLQVLFCHQGRSKLSSKRQQDTWRATAMSSKIAFERRKSITRSSPSSARTIHTMHTTYGDSARSRKEEELLWQLAKQERKAERHST